MAPACLAQARLLTTTSLQEAGLLVALDAIIKLLDKSFQRRSTGMGPERELKHINAPTTGLTTADDILANLHPSRQLRLTDPSIRPEDVEFLQEQLIFLTIKRASHPAAVAHAAAQDQLELELWENAILRLPISAPTPEVEGVANIAKQSR